MCYQYHQVEGVSPPKINLAKDIQLCQQLCERECEPSTMATMHCHTSSAEAALPKKILWGWRTAKSCFWTAKWSSEINSISMSSVKFVGTLSCSGALSAPHMVAPASRKCIFVDNHTPIMLAWENKCASWDCSPGRVHSKLDSLCHHQRGHSREKRIQAHLEDVGRCTLESNGYQLVSSQALVGLTRGTMACCAIKRVKQCHLVWCSGAVHCDWWWWICVCQMGTTLAKHHAPAYIPGWVKPQLQNYTRLYDSMPEVHQCWAQDRTSKCRSVGRDAYFPCCPCNCLHHLSFHT